MKRNSLILAALALVILLFGAGPAYAQQPYMFIDVPCAFTVQDTEFTAGKYEIRRLDNYGHVFVLRNMATHATKGIITIPAVNRNYLVDSQLVFNRYNNHDYFLAKVSLAGKSTSNELLKSRRERELALAAADIATTRLLAKGPEPAK